MDWTQGPADTWASTAAFLRGLPARLPAVPKALLVISSHWESSTPQVTAASAPALIYDYSGFPAHTYELTWPAPGAPGLASRVQQLLTTAGIHAREDKRRGLDHGVFIPLKVAFPEASIPTVQLSLKAGLDPEEHLAMGRALAPLRDEGVLILGSGMSYHNMRAFMTPQARQTSGLFADWLADAVARPVPQRDARLKGWAQAPGGRESHPREEHLLPLMVAAGAASADPGREIFRAEAMGAVISAIQFG